MKRYYLSSKYRRNYRKAVTKRILARLRRLIHVTFKRRKKTKSLVGEKFQDKKSSCDIEVLDYRHLSDDLKFDRNVDSQVLDNYWIDFDGPLVEWGLKKKHSTIAIDSIALRRIRKLDSNDYTKKHLTSKFYSKRSSNFLTNLVNTTTDDVKLPSDILTEEASSVILKKKRRVRFSLCSVINATNRTSIFDITTFTKTKIMKSALKQPRQHVKRERKGDDDEKITASLKSKTKPNKKSEEKKKISGDKKMTKKNTKSAIKAPNLKGKSKSTTEQNTNCYDTTYDRYIDKENEFNISEVELRPRANTERIYELFDRRTSHKNLDAIRDCVQDWRSDNSCSNDSYTNELLDELTDDLMRALGGQSEKEPNPFLALKPADVFLKELRSDKKNFS